MISVIITSKNEPSTIAKAVIAFLNENYLNKDFEILVVSPDSISLSSYPFNDWRVRLIKDKGHGKPAALNLAIQKAKGDILIFSDGDVLIKKESVKELLKIIMISNAAVSGRPISINDKNNKFGFWAYVLLDTAHMIRKKKNEQKKFLLLSGYLFAIKKKAIINFKFPKDSLTEDEYLSYFLWHKNYKIKYCPKAKVNVKFPNNYSDWLKQKTRTLGGFYQVPKKWKQKIVMRNFLKESIGGFSMWQIYAKTWQQKYWLIILFIARLHAWFMAFIKIRLFKRKASDLWKRIESTK